MYLYDDNFKILVKHQKIYIYVYCFKSFYSEYFSDNQIDKIIGNDIFRRFNILSFTRYIYGSK